MAVTFYKHASFKTTRNYKTLHVHVHSVVFSGLTSQRKRVPRVHNYKSKKGALVAVL